jgi:dihydropyrimidinase
MASFDVVITGGLVASSSKLERLDLGIRDGKIAARAASLSRNGNEAARTIDATGKLVLPGALDTHFHPQYGDNIEVGSVAAAHGGITTLVSFVYGGKHVPGGYEGVNLTEAFEEFSSGDGANSTLDWGAHMGVLDPKTIDQIPEIAAKGINSFKFFMAYKRRGMMVDDQEFLHAMKLVGENDGIAMVHAENGYGIDYLEQRFIAEGKTGLEYFEPSRPKNIEYEAVNRAIQLASVVDCPLYLVHMTTGESVAMIAAARDAGQHVVGETCPQYLLQTNESLLAYGTLGICTPPYRTQWDNDTLWQGLSDGVISTVGSDHSPHPREKKMEPNIFKIPVGTPQVETMLPLLFGKGVSEGRITIQRLVAVLCENPARVFGLYPRKGTLDVGADADVVIVDPTRELTVKEDQLHSVVDYNPYNGWTMLGAPVHTLQRGSDVLVDGELKAKKGDGQFVPAGGAPLPTV